jgi:diguanylate cyclase (GGDEF)-like protein
VEPVPGDEVPPSVRAAQQEAERQRSRREVRGYGLPTRPPDVDALSLELSALHALLRAGSEADVTRVVTTLVHDLGGALVPARYADPTVALPMDASLGLSEPLLPFADPVSVAAMRLSDVLPGFLEAARLVLGRLQGEARQAEEATRDSLTGLLTRRAWMRRLSEAVPGDGICLIDLDHFKTVNDTSGHAAGDAVLRAIGGIVLRTFRSNDACGRYGGDELVCLTPGLSGAGLVDRCDRVRATWHEEMPPEGRPVGLSVGVAVVGPAGGRAALQAADSAMYRAKSRGRNLTMLAPSEPGLTRKPS